MTRIADKDMLYKGIDYEYQPFSGKAYGIQHSTHCVEFLAKMCGFPDQPGS